MWLDNIADSDVLRCWVHHCPAMKLVSTMDGKILWGNMAFCEWSQYTLSELTKLTWMQLSVADENLEYDIAEAKRLDAYNPIYQVRKQYIPNGGKPEWGVLTVMRYPLAGEMQFALCTWTPLKNGTAEAFTLAMENGNRVAKRLDGMTTVLNTLTSQTEEDRYVLSTINMIRKHPKAVMAFIVVTLGLFGMNNTLEFLQRVGLVSLPLPKIEIKEPDRADTKKPNGGGAEYVYHQRFW